VTNLLSNTLEDTMKLIEMGIIPKLFKIAKSKDDEKIKSSIFWALGNIAGEFSGDIRDMLMNEGIWDFAKDTLMSKTDFFTVNDYIGNIGFFLLNVLRTKPILPSEIIITIIPGVCSVIKRLNNNDDISNTYLNILVYITNNSKETIIMKIVENGMCPIFINFIKGYSQLLFVPAMRIVGNIAQSNNEITQKLIDTDVLSALESKISLPKDNIKKEVCWIISNITAGTKMQAEDVLNCGLLEKIVDIVNSATEPIKTRKEAIFAISNATAVLNDSKYKEFMVKKVLPCFVKCLNNDSQITEQLIIVILESIENLLKSEFSEEIKIAVESLGGLDKIEALQNHINNIIYKKAVKILDQHFGADEVKPDKKYQSNAINEPMQDSDKMDDIPENVDINMENLKL